MTPQRSPSARPARPEQRRYAIEAYRSLPVTFVRRVVLGRDPYWRRYFWSRWGFLPRDVRRALRRRPTVVLNALSGEVTQLVGFCRALRAALPDHALLFITNNRYSYDFGVANLAVDAVLDSPWDCRGPVRRFLRAISPAALVAVESMTSPVLFEEGRTRGAVTLVISGLMSGNFDRHPMQARSLEAGAFAALDGIGAKSEDDARAFVARGARADRTVVTGNLRFDFDYLHVDERERAALRSALQLVDGEPVLVGASVHPGEERLVGEAYVDARATIPGLRLILVPRYDFHVDGMIAELKTLGLRCVRRTALAHTRRDRDDVIVVDTFGELNRLYALASVVFLGGTTYLRNVVGAGQNPIEPLVQRRTFFFGPHMGLWAHVTSRLKAVWPALEVTTAKELASGVVALSEDAALAARLRETIDAIVSEHREDVQRNVDFVAHALGVEPVSPGSHMVAVRHLAPADVAGLKRLFADLRREGDPNIWPNFLGDHDAERFCRERRDTPAVVVVAVGEAGEMAGFVSMFIDDGYARLTLNVVHPRWRGQGVGRRLLLYALAAAHDAGARVVGLGVFADNAAALALYHQLGFTVCQDHVFMRKARLFHRVCAVMGVGSASILVARVAWKAITRPTMRLIELVYDHQRA